MNEWVFVVLAVVNVISLVLIFIMYHNMISMKIHVTQMHTGMSAILGRVMNLEQLLARVSNGFTELITSTESLIDRIDSPSGQLFKTTDGKYMASSLDELINKMKGDKKDSEYFSDEEINKLRNLFDPGDDDDIDDLDDLEDTEDKY